MERLERMLQCDIIQAIEDGFNGHDIKRDEILKDVNWLIEQVLKVEKLENELTGYKLSNKSLSNALDKEVHLGFSIEGQLHEANEKLKQIRELINDERITKSETVNKISKIVNA